VGSPLVSQEEWDALLDLVTRLRKASRHYSMSLCAEAADKLEFLMSFASDMSYELEGFYAQLNVEDE
jgi:hypothetical protein